MKDNKVYNLRPLKWVILGLVISSVSIFLQMGAGLVDTDLLSVVILFGVVRIIGWVIVILGLRKIREYSKFNKCYKWSLWILIMMVISSISLILMVMIMTFFYYLLKSIEEMALQLGNIKFGNSVSNIWIFSAWVTIFNFCFTPIISMIIFDEILISKNTSILLSIINIIISFIVYVFIYLAYKELDGREIPDFSLGENN